MAVSRSHTSGGPGAAAIEMNGNGNGLLSPAIINFLGLTLFLLSTHCF